MTYYDINGEAISIERFLELSRNFDYREIGRTKVGNALVSTVWLGIDHNFGFGPIHIFETMIFWGTGGTGEEQSWRYPTLGQAIAGHHQQVLMLEEESSHAVL